MARTPLKNLISGYETPVYPREDGGEINTGVKFVERSVSGNVTSRKKKILSSPVVSFFNRLSRIISYTGTRGYGALFLSYGLLTVTSELAKAYFNVEGADVLFPSVLGAIFAMLAIPLLLADKPFCIALQDFALTDYVFFEFFSIKRMHRQTEERGIPPFAMAVIGIVFATLGMFFGTRAVFALLLAAAAVYLSFIAPEFAFFSTIIALPVLTRLENGMIILVCMIGAAFISFMRKVVFGKRVYSIEQYDAVIIAFMLCILISGIFMQGLASFESSMTMILFALGYPLASNLLANRRLAECALGAVVISSMLTSGYTVYEISRLVASDGGGALFSYTASATFSSVGAFAVFLLIAIFASAYFVATLKHKPIRVLYIALLLLNVISLILTRRVDAMLALVAGAVVYLVQRHGRRLAPLAVLVIPLPLLSLIIPSEWLGVLRLSVGECGRASELLELWRSSLSMLGDNLFTGIGMGSDSFASAIGDYGTTAASSSSLPLEVACEAGVFALVFFLVLIIIRAIHCAIYREYVASSRVTHLAYTSATMVAILLSAGLTEYIWSDVTVYYLFWCILGLGSAALRIAKREHDDKVMYYGDLASVDSSVLDVKIR